MARSLPAKLEGVYDTTAYTNVNAQSSPYHVYHGFYGVWLSPIVVFKYGQGTIVHYGWNMKKTGFNKNER